MFDLIKIIFWIVTAPLWIVIGIFVVSIIICAIIGLLVAGCYLVAFLFGFLSGVVGAI